MDLITYIKKEEPVEYVLTINDQGKVQELTISEDVTTVKLFSDIKISIRLQ